MFENRPLQDIEKEKMPETEQEVIDCYERTTKKPFMRYDVPILKQLTQVATPDQINSQIRYLYYKYPQNFKEFSYVVPIVVNFFKNKRGKKSGKSIEK
jgi:hypothetical protein